MVFSEKITIKDFADIFGEDEASFSLRLKHEINSHEFSFRKPTSQEYKSLILEVLKKIKNDTQKIGAKERLDVWQCGWQENLDAYSRDNLDKTHLIPKFIRKGNPVRWKKNYVFPASELFEINFIKIYRQWFGEQYLTSCDIVHEFGCGTGHNLLALAEMFPKKSFRGSDFVDSAVSLTNKVGKEKKIDLSAQKFDMLSPDYSYGIGASDGVFTFGALEQLASNLSPMLEFLLDKKPSIVIHTEPVEEFYDLESLEDFLAYTFQSNRGYSSGLISKLEELELKGKIEIIKAKRLFFGSFFMEGYNHIAWRPKT